SSDVVAGEVEIDESCYSVVEHQHIVGKEVGVDDRARQVAGPLPLQPRQLALYQGGELGMDRVEPFCAAGPGKRLPVSEAQRIFAMSGKVGCGEMNLRQRRADRVRLRRVGRAQRNAGQEFDQRQRLALMETESLAVTVVDRARHRAMAFG